MKEFGHAWALLQFSHIAKDNDASCLFPVYRYPLHGTTVSLANQICCCDRVDSEAALNKEVELEMLQSFEDICTDSLFTSYSVSVISVIFVLFNLSCF